MASSELREELQELRTEMEAQKAASREKAVGRKATEQSTSETVAASAGDEGDTGSDTAKADLTAQLRELGEKFEGELKDTHPGVLLGVFAAGVLVGRILSR